MENLNEAPSSVTLSVITPKGYNALFTLRDVEAHTLVKKIATIEDYFEKMGYKPQPAKSFGNGGFQKKEPIYVEGHQCPTCGERLVEAHKKTGELYWKCSTNKWDKIANKATGCSYINWNPVIV